MVRLGDLISSRGSLSCQHQISFSVSINSTRVFRQLTDAITAHIFPAEQSMASVVVIGPNAEGSIHSHPQEQWSILIEGSATRIHEGEHIAVSKGDFWVAPGNTEHGIIGGPEGAVIIDILPRHGQNMACRVAVSGSPMAVERISGDFRHIDPARLDAWRDIPVAVAGDSLNRQQVIRTDQARCQWHAAPVSGLYDQCFRR